MANIFISYPRGERKTVDRLARIFDKLRVSYWYDKSLVPTHDFSDEIKDQIDRSTSVIVIWSEESVRSPWVKAEAARAHDQGKLISAHVEKADLPLPHSILHSADLRAFREIDMEADLGWGDEGLQSLLSRVGQSLERGAWLVKWARAEASPDFEPELWDEIANSEDILHEEAAGRSDAAVIALREIIRARGEKPQITTPSRRRFEKKVQLSVAEDEIEVAKSEAAKDGLTKGLLYAVGVVSILGTGWLALSFLGEAATQVSGNTSHPPIDNCQGQNITSQEFIDASQRAYSNALDQRDAQALRRFAASWPCAEVLVDKALDNATRLDEGREILD